MSDADAQLMLEVRAGDMSAFEVLVRKHRPGVTQFLFGMIHDRAIAEELCQDAFLRLYLTRERYEPTAKFTSWLYLIARHLGSTGFATMRGSATWSTSTRHGRDAGPSSFATATWT